MGTALFKCYPIAICAVFLNPLGDVMAFLIILQKQGISFALNLNRLRMLSKIKSNYIHYMNTISSFLTHVLAPLAPVWDLKMILLHIQVLKEVCHPL